MRHATTISSSSRSSGPIAAAAQVESANGGQASNHHRAKRLWILCLVMVLCWLFSGIAFGQAFETINLPAAAVTPEKIAGYERAAKTLASTRKAEQLTDDVKKDARIYIEYIVPYKMVRKEYLKEMAPMLAALEKSVSRAQGSNTPGKTILLKNVYNGMTKVAKGNYIPAARINAVLVLGRLDSLPYDGNSGRPPRPLGAVVPALFNTLVGLYEDEQEVDGVRAAALQSLHRIAMYGFPSLKAENKAKLTQVMTDLLEAPAPEGRDAKAHAYLQRFAVDILHYISTPQDKTLGKQLISISTNEEQPDLIALYSASQLGDMSTELEGQVADTEGVLKSWSRRAFATVESEINRLNALDRTTTMAVKQPPSPDTFLGVKEEKKKQKDKSRTGAGMMGGGMGMGMDDMMGGMGMDDSMMMDGMDMGMGMDGMEGMGMDEMMGGMGMGMMGRTPAAKPQPPEVSLSRRRITMVLQQLLRGAVGSPVAEVPNTPSGLISAASDEDKKTLTSWVDDIRPIAEAINDDMLDDKKKWMESLEEQRVALAKLAGVELSGEDEDDGGDRRAVGLPMLGLPGDQPAALPGDLPAADAPGAGLPEGGLPGAGLPGAN